MKLIGMDKEFIDEISSQTLSEHSSVSVVPLSQKHKQVAVGGPVIFVANLLEPSDIVSSSADPKCQFLLQKNTGFFDLELRSAAKLAEDPQSYFSDQFQFSGEKIIKSLKLSFATPSDKPELKKRSLDMISKLNSNSTLEAANAIIEELYMNALFDAPPVEDEIQSSKKAKPAHIQLIQTEKFLQISCTDYYGSLEISKFLQRMRDIYENGAGEEMNMDLDQGAGLGCVILFEHSSCMVLGVQPGAQTKVTCVLPLGMSNLRRSQMKKSLHWFQI